MRVKKILEKHGDLETDAFLKDHTTFRVGGSVEYLIYPKNELSLLRILEVCRDEKLPYKVIGKGSNMLFSDEHFHGVIICLDRYFIDFSFEVDGTCTAQAGVSLILLSHGAMKKSFCGLEFASGIPATVGGALFMNAGAYKSDMSSIVEKIHVLKGDHCDWMDKEELEYSYRHSKFQDRRDWIILGAKFKLVPGDQKEIRELIDTRRCRRKESQPLEKPSAGSIFRNPEDQPAWKLIDDCGLRGIQIGGAKVSDKHSNFVVNEGDASAKDIDMLVSLIQEKVYNKFQVQLKMEVEKFNWENIKTEN